MSHARQWRAPSPSFPRRKSDQSAAAVIVFDLDNTLYPEITYVHSGFRAVAEAVAEKYGVEEARFAARCRAAFRRHGRGTVFNRVLEDFGLLTTARVRKCVSIYRLHRPTIRLYPDADRCLKRFAAEPLYIVTDGIKTVQARKIDALALWDRVRRVFITHRHGRSAAKPSPYCFRRISMLEGAEPPRIIYVGDDPAKDFVGIRPLGFRTIRVMRGEYAQVQLGAKHDADISVMSLDELDGSLLRELVRR